MKTKSVLFCVLIAVFLSGINKVKAQVDVNDSLALVDLYNSTDGPNWFYNNWLKGPVSTWYGITVMETRVTQIKLYDNYLAGILPVSFGNLTNLEYLDLGENLLTGRLPASFGNLTSLQELYLYDNEITSLPASFGNLASLKLLELSRNQLTALPESFGNLANLLDLRLGQNLLTSLPASLGNLASLKVLHLCCNQLTSLPPEIGKLASLEILGLSSNQLTSFPLEIAKLAKLQHLDLSSNKLSALPTEIGNLAGLQSLYLHNNQITALTPEIGNLINLIDLYLFNNQLTSLPPEIGNLVNLDYLYLVNNQLTSLPPEIGNLPRIDGLYLDNNHLTFESLEPIVTKLASETNLTYSPQANITLHQNSNSLSVSAGGTLSNNTYQWFMVGETNPTTIVADSFFYPSQKGKYSAAVTNSICTQLTLYTDTLDYEGVLPVNIINLKAQQQGIIITVEWTGLTEINVNNYEIQHSADSRSFTTVGKLPARSNGTAHIQYTYDDAKPVKGDNFYRIKAVDKDGTLTYSNTVVVNVVNDRNITLVYPNPAKNVLNVQINGSGSFSLTDQNGKVLFTKTISNSAAIDISRFAAGLYYLKNNNTGEVQKVVVEK